MYVLYFIYTIFWVVYVVIYVYHRNLNTVSVKRAKPSDDTGEQRGRVLGKYPKYWPIAG